MGGQQSKKRSKNLNPVTAQAAPKEKEGRARNKEIMHVIVEGNRAFQFGKWETAEKFYHEGINCLIGKENMDENESCRNEAMTVPEIVAYADKFKECMNIINATEDTAEESKVDDCKNLEIALLLSDFLNNLGAVKYVKKDFQSSLTLHQKALELRIILKGEVSTQVAESYQNLSSVNDAMQHFSKAESQLLNAIQIEAKCHAEDSVEASSMSNNLAVLYTHMGRLREAELILKKVLSRRLHIFGSKHRLTLNAQSNLDIVMDLAAKRCYDELDRSRPTKEERTASLLTQPPLADPASRGPQGREAGSHIEKSAAPRRMEILVPFPPAMLDDVESPEMVASNDTPKGACEGGCTRAHVPPPERGGQVRGDGPPLSEGDKSDERDAERTTQVGVEKLM